MDVMFSVLFGMAAANTVLFQIFGEIWIWISVELYGVVGSAEGGRRVMER